jgi:hypothetical protein
MATKPSSQLLAHIEWIGFVRPTGLVVSPKALEMLGVILDQNDFDGQQLLRAAVAERTFPGGRGPAPYLRDFESFARQVLGWSFSPRGYAGTEEAPIPAELEVPFGDGEVLRPDFAVRERDVKEGALSWQLLVQVLSVGEELDKPAGHKQAFELTPHGRLERLLRKTGVSAGLLSNGRTLRLLSAPYGETSGWIDFQVSDMLLTAGRSIVSALRLLLSESRLLALPRRERLPSLLEESRKYQNTVSERLAEQVLHALYELLRGFQAAHDASRGELLRGPLRDQADQVYRALLTVILRLVFLLYAEERELLPGDERFRRYYRLTGLYERLREDAALHPDTLDQRFGAWAQLLVLFRLIHDGAQDEQLKLPRRHGELFDPDRFPFLEGRAGLRQKTERIEPPLVPDGTIYRSLEKLLVLDGERISYRALDVEQIGSVYETMMGFRLETATGLSVAIKAPKKHGAPTTVDLEALLMVVPDQRETWLHERTERKVAEGVRRKLKPAATLEELHAALLTVVDLAATPDLVPQGAMVLQPSEERRRSGSHYTPRALTEPIVKTALEPILARLRGEDGKPPRPERILDLKVCDPAMGSGAFLVEACRQLGDALIDSWRSHRQIPTIPADEDELVYARRLVAQRCLYGVDRNPMAVDLAKVSLWLATLAREHALTFVDHALRHGDSLVGLSLRQIEAFHWDESAPLFQAGIEVARIREHTEKILELRQEIREAGEEIAEWEMRDLWDKAQFELSKLRIVGDLVLAAFFDGSTDGERERRRLEYARFFLGKEDALYQVIGERFSQEFRDSASFHWEIEFPEVFGRESGGFDAFFGNPPFAGGSKTSSNFGKNYLSYLLYSFSQSNGKCDLVAYFIRRAFDLLRRGGTLGFVATNTIRQGVTRFTGLRWIRTHGGTIYAAARRQQWPGIAAVVVSLVYIIKEQNCRWATLDGRKVDKITAYLMRLGPDEDPVPLAENAKLAFSGINPNGKGFILTEIEREALVAHDPKSSLVIKSFLGSAEMNDSPLCDSTRFIIDVGDYDEANVRHFGAVYSHLFNTVRIQRAGSAEKRLRERWWNFSRPADELKQELQNLGRVLVNGRVATFHTFAFQATTTVFSDAVTVFLLDRYSDFAVLQSRVHETWAGFQGSSFKDDPRYIPEDCFETFPFPKEWQAAPRLEESGKEYYQARAALMIRHNQGLTKTYTRFHNPAERDPSIERLRELHEAMDRALLEAYGWSDIPTGCDFFPDFTETDEDGKELPKSIRYRWSDEVRDEVLARLLELNAQRAQEERLAGLATKPRPAIEAKPVKSPRLKKAPPNPESNGQGSLF